MAGSDSGPITSELQAYRLTTVIPLSRQRADLVYQEQWEQVDFNNISSHVQELRYAWEACAVFIEKDTIQTSVGRYDNLTLPPVSE